MNALPPIGPKIRALRQERGWTQARLAALLGITQGYLSQLERGDAGSFTAEQLLLILRQFNVPIDRFLPGKGAEVSSQIQNALARTGAPHLVEAELLPSEKLRSAADTIRETLVSADSARQIAALAPVVVENAGRLNLTRLRAELAALGLERRFGWAVESILEAVKRESELVLPREWRLKYRRAVAALDNFISPLILFAPTENPDRPTPHDLLDPDITGVEALNETVANSSETARKWRVATRIETDDFVRALRAARGAD
ncbi:MAG: helix-turn-helix domain-containing protein [Elusimicrobiota bacterium]|nr:MAG: helix-turn-helix domain-containing protein [Elusimicrobiota bacterium]